MAQWVSWSDDGGLRRAAAGSMPLLLSSGAGTETRVIIGTVILWGVLAATAFTLVVPVAYHVLACRTGSPGAVKRRLQLEMESQAGGGQT